MVIEFYEDIHVVCIDSVWVEVDVCVQDECLLEGVKGDYTAC